jgi:hypothetical protein
MPIYHVVQDILLCAAHRVLHSHIDGLTRFFFHLRPKIAKRSFVLAFPRIAASNSSRSSLAHPQRAAQAALGACWARWRPFGHRHCKRLRHSSAKKSCPTSKLDLEPCACSSVLRANIYLNAISPDVARLYQPEYLG